MSRHAYSRSCVFYHQLFLLSIYIAALTAYAGSIARHGIPAPLSWQRAIRHLAPSMAHIMPPLASSTPVRVVVHTYWGEESCFNTRINLNCSIEDTGLSIKHKIAAATGVPVSLQKLYVNDTIWTMGSRTPLGDRERVAEYQSLLKLRHDTKEMQLNVVLELPAPLCHKLKVEPERREEYIEALRRYSALLSKVKEARKDPKVLLEPAQIEVDEARSAVLEKHQPIASATPPPEPNRKMFILPNNRIHLLFFHDMPQCQNSLSEHVSLWWRRQLPIDWALHAKFAFMCYVIRATCDHEPWVKNLLKYAPPIVLLCNSRPGTLLCRTIFHLLPTHLIPKGRCLRFEKHHYRSYY